MIDKSSTDGQQQSKSPEFIDVFAGAGGLSLGLLQAGWRGRFAIEKSPMAFHTLKHNLVGQEEGLRFDWPEWLPREAMTIENLIEKYSSKLQSMKDIPLLAGGPPCQGFSTAGQRKYDDVRNLLVERYLSLVELIQPQMLLLENVAGFATTFEKTRKGTEGKRIDQDQFNADKALRARLLELKYTSFVAFPLRAKAFGVPQWRPRYILIAVRDKALAKAPNTDPLAILKGMRNEFLSGRGLPTASDVTLKAAISDLEKAHGTVECIETGMRRFRQGVYGPVDGPFQCLLRKQRNGTPIADGTVADSHRFPNHSDDVISRFERILREFRPGVQLSDAERESLGLNKHRIAPLSADQACHTLTSLPDDLIHYKEPRIPTVREYARIQSFPDWFEFKDKYTSGGDRRASEVPRYTQAANAVPPLLGEALGLALLEMYRILSGERPPREDIVQPVQRSLFAVPLRKHQAAIVAQERLA